MANNTDKKAVFDDFMNKFSQEKSDIIQIKGLGGIGKTSFVYNFCEKLLNNEIELYKNYFQYIIWITGKMTLFQPSGQIVNIKNEEITFDDFIACFDEVFQIDSGIIDEKVKKIINLLESYKCLIVIDNMETINNKEINNFLLKVPKNSKIIITSRENLENMTSPIVNIIGFEKDEFTTYFSQQLKLYGESDKNIDLYLSDEKSIDKLLEYTYGSPIIINMIAHQLAMGNNLNSILEIFSSKQKGELELYDKVMDFCFNEIFSKLNNIDKSILYILSIPQSNDKKFKIDDLAFILDEKKHLIQDTILNLVKLSFVLKDDNLYYSPPLVKIFSNHKLSSADIDTYNLGLKYAELNRWHNDFDERQEYYFDLTKAYTEQEKIIALKMKDIVNDFRITSNLNIARKELDTLIKEAPNFARLYYEYSQILCDAMEDENLIRKYFDLATEKDAKNDFYWVKYANFELSRSQHNAKNREKAINYFKNAITINENNYHANHGLAIALSRNYQQNIPNDIYQEIVKSFEKGFSPSGINKNHDIVNAHAYASFMQRMGEYQTALNICEKQIEKSGRSKKLEALEGGIQKNIDPSFIGQTKIKRFKNGILANQNDDVIKKLINILEKVDEN